jgi:TPR repeat protein
MRSLRAGLLLLGLLVALPPATAQDLSRGLQAYEDGDYATALAEWRPLAWQGNAAAQYGLGRMYDRGYGVTADPAQAAGWYRRAAEQGAFPAQHALGVLYAAGRGVPMDHASAADWYGRAAEQGYASAQLAIGILLELGLGVPADPVEAFKWFDLAAAQGRDDAATFREEVAAQMAPAAIAEAEARAAAPMSPQAMTRYP